MKGLLVFFGLFAMNHTVQAAPKPLDEKPILVKALLKIHGQVLSMGMNINANQTGSVDTPQYRLSLTPVVRDGKMIEISADILQKIDGGLRRVASPKIVTLPGQEATISESGKAGFQLSVEPNVD
jgi:hypothetical protein